MSAAKAIDKADQKKIQNAIESSEQEAAIIVAAILSPRKEPQNGQSKEPQNRKDIQKEPQIFQSKEPQNGQEEEQADTLMDIGLPRIFLSSKQHSSKTPEDLSERWRLSLAQATLILKATT